MKYQTRYLTILYLMLDVLLDLLDPLKADAGGADDEGGPGLDLLALDPAVGTHVLTPATHQLFNWYTFNMGDYI
jgi:hypothetical protein